MFVHYIATLIQYETYCLPKAKQEQFNVSSECRVYTNVEIDINNCFNKKPLITIIYMTVVNQAANKTSLSAQWLFIKLAVSNFLSIVQLCVPA